MPASGSAAILAVQMLTFLQGPLVASGEPAPPRQPPPSIQAQEARPVDTWLVVGASPTAGPPPAAGAQ
jgi:hypothetical protein